MGSAKDFEQEIVLEQIKSYFEKYGESKFITIADYTTASEKAKSIDRIGYKQKIDGNYHYFVLPECYKTELCKGLNYTQVTKYLVEHGFLQPDNHGKNLVVKSLPNIGKVRVYHFNPKILS